VILSGKIRTEMSYSANTVSFSTTGNKNFAVGSSVQGYRITLCGVPGSNEAYEHRSVGVCTSTVQSCHATIQDQSNTGRSNSFTDRVINHYYLSSGVITDGVVGTHVSFNAGTGFTINLTTTSASWQFLVEIWT